MSRTTMIATRMLRLRDRGSTAPPLPGMKSLMLMKAAFGHQQRDD